MLVCYQAQINLRLQEITLNSDENYGEGSASALSKKSTTAARNYRLITAMQSFLQMKSRAERLNTCRKPNMSLLRHFTSRLSGVRWTHRNHQPHSMLGCTLVYKFARQRGSSLVLGATERLRFLCPNIPGGGCVRFCFCIISSVLCRIVSMKVVKLCPRPVCPRLPFFGAETH